jgi:hypothetical protein
MKLKLSLKHKDRGGDVVAIGTLRSFLEMHMPKDMTFNQTVLGLWLKYLNQISGNLVGSNYSPKIIQRREFDLPFEKDYEELHPKEKGVFTLRGKKHAK